MKHLREGDDKAKLQAMHEIPLILAAAAHLPLNKVKEQLQILLSALLSLLHLLSSFQIMWHVIFCLCSP